MSHLNWPYELVDDDESLMINNVTKYMQTNKQVELLFFSSYCTDLVIDQRRSIDALSLSKKRLGSKFYGSVEIF